jgi:hypothetical protein
MKALLIVFSIILASARAFASEFPPPDYRSIGEGVWYGTAQVKSPRIVYHVIKCDRTAGNLALNPVRPRRDETLTELASRLKKEGSPLLGAITGDYFNYIRGYKLVLPWGILAREGKLLFSPEGKSAFCGGAEGWQISVPTMRARIFNPGDRPGVRVAAVNRPVELEGTDCGLFNSTWGDFALEAPKGFAVIVTGDEDFHLARAAGGKVAGISRLPVKVPIPEQGFVMVMKELPPADRLDLKLGAEVRVEIELSPSLESAIGGGPRIVREGKVSVEMDRENFSPGRAFYIKNSRHPRSAVGIGGEGKIIYLVVIEGRSDRSRGATLEELARLLLSLGGVEAMAFDGGRSVSMYVDGREAVEGDRRMADVLGIFQIEP